MQPREGERVAIVHIGQTKSGSTSIQSALAGYDDGSAFYAAFTNGDPNHTEAIHHAFGDPPDDFIWRLRHGRSLGPEETRRMRERYRAEFSAMLERRDRDRIVVSGEGVWGLKNAQKAELVEFIRSRGWEVCVVAYLRDPAPWAASWISTRVFGFALTQIPPAIAPEFRLGLETFAELLPPESLHLRVFDPALLTGGDPVVDFCHVAGLDASRLAISHANRDRSLQAVKLLFCFNRSGALYSGDPVLAHARNTLLWMVEEKYAARETIDPALCAGVADYSEAEWLFETFGVDFRRKSPSEASHYDLEAILTDLSDVDLSGLDECLATRGVAGEGFSSAEQKLHRLFQSVLIEAAMLKRPGVLFRKLTRILARKLVRKGAGLFAR